ncbi:MAG: cation-transporting P-type ATPase [Eubacteriales bacterium]
MESKNDWHLLTDRETLERLSVDMYKGLDDREAARRRKKYGSNSLWHIRHSPSLSSIASSVFDIATLILVVAAVCAALFDKSYEAGWLSAILIIGAVMRSVTFIRANRILEDSAKSKIPACSVIRGGKLKMPSALELVPGDIVFLEAGDTVPCDGRVVSGFGASVLERGITENKTPVKKFNSAIQLAKGSHDVPCEYRSNMLFAGSSVISGSVRMVVTATGDDTLIAMKQGGIELETAEIPEIEKLKIKSRTVSLVMLGCVMVLTVLSMALGKNNSLPSVFLSSMAMATAAMSEFLTVIGYIIFSVSIRDCADKKWKCGHSELSTRAVIRNPEKLGGIGRVSRIVFCGSSYFKSGEAVISAYRTSGGYREAKDGLIEDKSLERIIDYAKSASLSVNTGLSSGGESVKNSESETLTSLAAEAYIKAVMKNIPSECALADHRGHEAEGSMGTETSLVLIENEFYAISCGKIDDVMRCCTSVETENGIAELDFETKKKIFTECARLEISGGRVVAVAKRKSQFQSLTRLPVLTQYMTFVGYFAIAEKEERYARENIEFLTRRGVSPILFTQNAQADYYYLLKLGLFVKNAKVLHATDNAGIESIRNGNNPAVISFEGMSEREFAASSAQIMKQLGGEDSIAVGRSVWNSGVLAEAEHGITVAASNVRTIPETLARNSDAVVYPDFAANGGQHDSNSKQHNSQSIGYDSQSGGLDGVVRVIKSSLRASGNIESAKFYLTASQSARLCVMFASVIFSLPQLSAVFILIWGLLFDFTASLVMAFGNFMEIRSSGIVSSKADNGDEDEATQKPVDFSSAVPVIFGIIWGAILSLTAYLALYVTKSAGEGASVLSGGVILSGLILTEVILKPKKKRNSLSNADILFILFSAALTSFLMLTKVGAKLCSGEAATLSALFALIPAAAITVLYFICYASAAAIRRSKK